MASRRKPRFARCREAAGETGARAHRTGGSRVPRCIVRVLFIFLDGVGLGDADVGRNVFRAAPPPLLTRLLGGRPLVRDAAPLRTSAVSMIALDARLGVAGTPQSGTGQASLFTGVNAAVAFGRHFGPWVPAALRPWLRAESLLALAARAGKSVAFANAYPEEVRAADSALPSDTGSGRSRRAARFLSAGPPIVALGAGVLDRHTPELERGDAVASEITNEGWRERLGRRSVPSITPEEAGRNLSRIAAAHDLTLFAHYSTDHAGHEQSMAAARNALARVDAFLDGLLAARSEDTLVVVASDHGNLEDIATDHTLNPALGLAFGPDHGDVTARWSSILDVTPTVLRVIGVDAAASELPPAQQQSGDDEERSGVDADVEEGIPGNGLHSSEGGLDGEE